MPPPRVARRNYTGAHENTQTCLAEFLGTLYLCCAGIGVILRDTVRIGIVVSGSAAEWDNAASPICRLPARFCC
jgi:hypothetical protein